MACGEGMSQFLLAKSTRAISLNLLKALIKLCEAARGAESVEKFMRDALAE